MYDDMDGLEFADYGGDLGAWIDAEMIKDTLVAGGAGAAALMLTSMAVTKMTEQIEMLQRKTPDGAPDINAQRIQNGAIQILAGLVGGRALYNYNREASMGVIGGLASVGVANIVNGFLKDKAVSFSALPEDVELSELAAGDESLLSDYDEYGPGMDALSALETTSVSSAPGAFQGFADATVTPESLMGTVVQSETLGDYQPWLS